MNPSWTSANIINADLSFVAVCLLLLFTCFASTAQAQVEMIDSTFIQQIEREIDSLERIKKVEAQILKYENQLLKKEMQFNFADAIPLVRGLLLASSNQSFNDRDGAFRHMNRDGIDYVPASLPLLTALTMKAAGVESRSHTRRMMTASVLALTLSLGTTQCLQHSFHETRPNQKNDHSFPSGHSSFAFVSAAILHREFGHHSPWISVGGFTCATATEMLRLRHNEHFINDIFTGAGIGLLSTNLAYFLTDQIYGQDAINRPRIYRGDIVRLGRFLERPTNLAFFSGTELGSNSIRTADDIHLRTASTFTAGLEYSYYLTSHWAFAATARLSTTQVRAQQTGIQGNTLNRYHANAGIMFSQPIGLNQRLTLRAAVGNCMNEATRFRRIADGTTYAKLPSAHHAETSCGIGFDMIGTDKYVTGFSVDYIHTFSCPTIQPDRCLINSYWRILL